MFLLPDTMLALANDHHRELIAEADRERLLTSARRARQTRNAKVVRGEPDGSLASCGPPEAVPAQ